MLVGLAIISCCRDSMLPTGAPAMSPSRRAGRGNLALRKDGMPDPRPDASESSTALIARAHAGDRTAIDLLVRRYLPALRRWAHGRLPRNTRDLNDTDDLIQGTLIRALGRLQQFDPRQPHAFLFYLRRALLNQVRDKAREARRRPIRGELHEDLLDGRPTPLTAAVNADAMRSYERALSRLSE